MRHKENIRGGDIVPSPCAGAEYQLSAITYNGSTFLFAILCFVLFFRRLRVELLNSRALQQGVSRCSMVKENPRRLCGPAGLVCRPVTHFWGVTRLTAPLRESLCHVYCHVPRYAAWLQTHQTHLQEYWYWECRWEKQTYSWKHTCPWLQHDPSQTEQKINK